MKSAQMTRMMEGERTTRRADEVDRNGEEFRSGDEARAKLSAAPRSPSKMLWEKHVVSHIPFRCWCRHCVAGRWTERRHLGRKGAELDQQPYISIDYGYYAGNATPMLVAKDRLSGMVFALAGRTRVTRTRSSSSPSGWTRSARRRLRSGVTESRRSGRRGGSGREP